MDMAILRDRTLSIGRASQATAQERVSHFAELIVYRFNIYLEQSKFCEHYFRYVTEMRTLV
jgi:hypothetical protein